MCNWDSNATVTNYEATDRVLTPEERELEPVEFHGYRMFPEEFPSGRYNMGSSGTSSDEFIGPTFIPTDATREVQKYVEDAFGQWVPRGETVRDGGYLVHGGIGTTTWGCIKMCDADVTGLAGDVDAALASGGFAVLTVIDGTGSSTPGKEN